LDHPISGTQTLQVRGKLPVSLNEPITLTPLRVLGAETSAHRIRLNRRFGVLVETTDEEDVSLVEEPNGSVPVDGVRTIAVWDVTSDTAQIGLSVKLNNLLTTTTTVTSVKLLEEHWHVELDYHVVVEPTVPATAEPARADATDGSVEKKRGLLDLIQFDLPPEVVQLTPIDPPVAGKILDLSGSTRKRFLIRPDQPISDEYHWRGTITFERPPDAPRRVPEILALGAGDVYRYVVLPTRLAGRPIEWETQGLWPDTIPATYSGSPLEEHQAVFRAKAATTTAILKTVQRPTSWPRVRLADIRIAGQTDSVYCGVAHFYLEPAGHNRCVMQLPASCSLVHADVGGGPALLYSQLGPNEWQLMLGPDRLPQFIRVVYTGKMSGPVEPGGGPHAAAPVLRGITASGTKDIPIDRTLWTYFPLGKAVSVREVTATDTVTQLHQDLIRWETGLSMMDLATDVLADTSPDELMYWYVSWTRGQAAVRRRIANATGVLGKTNRRATELEKRWEGKRRAWATRLGAAGKPAPMDDGAAAAVEAVDVLTTITATPVVTTHLSSTQQTAQLPVASPHVGWGDLLLRILATVCLLLAMAALFVVNRRQPIGDLFLSYPRLVGVLAGLAWWLWLTPSVFGWIIVLASLVPSFRRFPVISSEPDTTRTGAVPLWNGSQR
jgi:hypothetical protein